MGILVRESGDRRYVIELKAHGGRQYWGKKSESPVENLDALVIETSGSHPVSAQDIGGFLRGYERGDRNKTKDAVRRAMQYKKEIWLVDVAPTKWETFKSMFTPFLHPILTARGILATPQLDKPGSAADRKRAISRVSRFARVLPIVSIRDAIIAHKIAELARKTGRKNIGITVGTGHVNLAELLQSNEPLTREEKDKIASRGAGALKMHRYFFDKREGRWEVEEHSL